MKVGVYYPDYNPISGGGYTYQMELIFSLSELAGESKHEFVVFTHDSNKIQNFIQSKSIQIVKIPLHPNLPKEPIKRAKYRINSFLNNFINAIYCVDNYGFMNRFEEMVRLEGIDLLWFPTPCSIPINIPYLATIWDLQHRIQPYFPEVTEDGIWESREAFNSCYLQRASIILVGTETGRKEVERFYQIPSERIKVLPLPTPRFSLSKSSKIEQDILEKYLILHDYIFYPAQFWSHKNHANLFLSLQILKQKYNLTISLVLVGSDKGNENYIRMLISKWELSSQVHILGFVPLEDMIALYQNALALTFVTFFGPDNLPPLEAFALGCPVIASKVSGAEEQLGDAALLVDPKSPEQIADTIFELYNSPELRKTLVERGLKRAQRWTGLDFVRGVFSILDEFEPIRRCWE